MIVSRPSPKVALPTEKDWVIQRNGTRRGTENTKRGLARFLIAYDLDLVGA